MVLTAYSVTTLLTGSLPFAEIIIFRDHSEYHLEPKNMQFIQIDVQYHQYKYFVPLPTFHYR